ncbi:MAG: c-type cytochrome, partial [Gaiellaceae bacterium]
MSCRSTLLLSGALVVLLSGASLPVPVGTGEIDPRQAPPTRPLVEGRQIFEAKGCGACHTVRGAADVAKAGPDLGRSGSWRDVMQF